jgi:hypothetical protein
LGDFHIKYDDEEARLAAEEARIRHIYKVNYYLSDSTILLLFIILSVM